MHRYGQGVDEDFKLAIDYYKKGCELGTFEVHLISPILHLVWHTFFKVTHWLISAWLTATPMEREWTHLWRWLSRATWKLANQVGAHINCAC